MMMKTIIAAFDDQTHTRGVTITGAMKDGKPYANGVYVPNKTLGELKIEVGAEVELTFFKANNEKGQYFRASAINLMSKPATEKSAESQPSGRTRKLDHEVQGGKDSRWTLTLDLGGAHEASVSKKALADAGIEVGEVVPGAKVVGTYEIVPSTRAGAQPGDRYARLSVESLVAA